MPQFFYWIAFWLRRTSIAVMEGPLMIAADQDADATDMAGSAPTAPTMPGEDLRQVNSPRLNALG